MRTATFGWISREWNFQLGWSDRDSCGCKAVATRVVRFGWRPGFREERFDDGRVGRRRIRKAGWLAEAADPVGDGGVAQLGEHLLCKQRVMGSSPFTSTRKSIQNKFRKGLAARTEIWMILAPLTGTVAQAKKTVSGMVTKEKMGIAVDASRSSPYDSDPSQIESERVWHAGK